MFTRDDGRKGYSPQVRAGPAVTQQDLIICKQCGTTHGPTEAKWCVRFKCDHCQQTHDTEDRTVPLFWALVQEANVVRFVLCPSCRALLLAFLNWKGP
jgi:formate dehydrogenase maturation protein FdhE